MLFTPGHSPGHVTYAIAASGGEAQDASAALRGRAVSGSVGRTDLPGGDWNVLERSIGSLLRALPAETILYPGHMGVTTLGRERDTNPFLAELRVAVGESRPARPEPDLAARAAPDGS